MGVSAAKDAARSESSMNTSALPAVMRRAKPHRRMLSVAVASMP